MILHKIVRSSDDIDQWTSSYIVRTTNKGKTRGEKIPEHPKPYRQRSITTHKRWQKLGDRLELVLRQRKRGVLKKHFMFDILLVVIIYDKNKFQPIIVFTIFC